jgi:hypothetical protein
MAARTVASRCYLREDVLKYIRNQPASSRQRSDDPTQGQARPPDDGKVLPFDFGDHLSRVSKFKGGKK